MSSIFDFVGCGLVRWFGGGGCSIFGEDVVSNIEFGTRVGFGR